MRASWAAILQRYGALFALVAVGTVASVRHEEFLTPENLFNVLRQNSMLGLVALGMTFVIVMGGIDLSVGAVGALGGIVAVESTGFGTFAAVLAALSVCTLLGACNGLVVVRGNVQPFVATLATAMAMRGLSFAWTGETSPRPHAAASGFRWLGRGYLGVIPVPVLVCAMAYLVGWVVLGRTRFGRHVYAVGDNAEASRLLGVDVARVRVGTYALSGALAGLGGVLLASRLGVAQPVAGGGWELDAIASVVVGGTLLSGGQGGAGPTLAGVMLLGIVFNVLNMEGTISSFWQSVIRGVFLLAVIVVQNRLATLRDRSSTR